MDSSTAINSIALLGADFVGLKPTMMVDEVINLSGQKLFENKKSNSITAPSSGIVKSINRGEKRRFLSLIIEADESLDSLNSI